LETDHPINENLELRFGGRNQHVCQISLNSERVGFRIVFFLGDLTWNDPLAKRFGLTAGP